jgi:hypothetical protein
MSFNPHQWYLNGLKKFQLSWSFDTLNTSEPTKNAFLIRRESDNVEQTFTFSEVINGTYATFINATNGAVRKWFGNLNYIEQTNTAYQPRLKDNSGNPYVDEYAQGYLLRGKHYASLVNDSIVTLIFKDELSNNNQRSNVAIRGFLSDVFALELTSTAGYVVYDKTGNMINEDYNFGYANNGLFKLLTFSKIGGVKKVYINNVDTAQGTSTFTIGANPAVNDVILGGRDNGYGKINKYQHLGLLTGVDLSTFDLSAYNLAIMTKYGI